MYAKEQADNNRFPLVSTIHDHQTRSGSQFVVNRTLNKQADKSPDIRAKTLFNFLPQDFRALPFNVYKSSLKRVLTDNPLYSLDDIGSVLASITTQAR